MNRDIKYWIIVASKDHVKTAIAEGIAQARHGKAAPLKRMRNGDFIIYYSGKQTMGRPEVCQEFTAIGKVMDDEIYPFQMSGNFCSSRRNIEFLPSDDVPILPLIPELDFINNGGRKSKERFAAFIRGFSYGITTFARSGGYGKKRRAEALSHV
jgi:hypothetical protein